MDDLPSILQGVDTLLLLGVNVSEEVDVEEARGTLRRLFLQKAKKFHPDKQKKITVKNEAVNLEFVKLKAAFDYLQTGSNFKILYTQSLNEIIAKKRRSERSKEIASKQATYLDALLKRERDVLDRKAHSNIKHDGDTSKKRKEYQHYSSEFFADSTKKNDHGSVELVIAAKTMQIARNSEVNCLLLSDHFPILFENYGLVSVEPLDAIETEDRNVRIGKIVFESHEQAIRALLYYRANKQKFRCDLYALAFSAKNKSDGDSTPKEISLDDMEASILSKFKQTL